MQNLAEFHKIIPMIMRETILTITERHHCVVNLQKLTRNKNSPDLVNFNAYAKFGLIVSIRFQDRKQKSDDNQGHNSVVNLRQVTRNNSKLELVMVNAFAKFYQSPSNHSQDIQQK